MTDGRAARLLAACLSARTLAAQVPAPGAPTDPDPGNTPLLIFGAVAVILAVIVGIVLLARRRH